MSFLRVVSPMLVAFLAACGGGGGETKLSSADSLARDLAMPPADTSATLSDVPAPPEVPAPAPPPSAARPPASRPAPAPSPAPAPPPVPDPTPPPAAAPGLPSGTRVTLAAAKEITSQANKAGETFTARVSEAVTDAAGRTVIPAGAIVTLVIDAIAPAENRGDTTGTLRLRATSVAIGGESFPLQAGTVSVASTLRGRGVTTGAAATVGAGAAAGAVAGRVLGGDRRGTVVGGVIGAATGAAIAAETADRDVVVAEGARIVIALRERFQPAPD